LLSVIRISNKAQHVQNLDINGINTTYGLNLHPSVFNLALIKTAHIIWVSSSSFIFFPWIHTGLQNPYGYEN
jgi:hypothetical protein